MGAFDFLKDAAGEIAGGALGIGSGLQQQAFSSREANKQRKWSRKNMRHRIRWSVQDLEAAGLNPILAAGSALGGGLPSGSSAQGGAMDIAGGMRAGTGASLGRKQRSLMDTQILRERSQVGLNNAQSQKALADQQKALADAQWTRDNTERLAPLKDLSNAVRTGATHPILEIVEQELGSGVRGLQELDRIKREVIQGNYDGVIQLLPQWARELLQPDLYKMVEPPPGASSTPGKPSGSPGYTPTPRKGKPRGK